jgi:hypothetical protein
MKIPTTNLLKFKKKGRKPEVGDIFAYQLRQFPDLFFFGRVVATDTNIGGMDGHAILIYLYKIPSNSMENIPSLSRDNLLVPPIGTNALAWTRGFFQTIRQGLNSACDLLPQHCFRDWPSGYVDEYGKRLLGPVEPVGINGISGIGSIDDKISSALGLPLAVDSSTDTD